MKTTKRIHQRGNALIEFAIGWSLLWLTFAGVYQFGYSFYAYNMLITGVGTAAQLGARLDYDTTDPTGFKQKVKNMVVYGDETAGTKSIVPGLATANVDVAVTADASGIPHDITVSIVNFQLNSIFTTWSWNGKPRATTAYYGKVVCSGC